MAGARDRVETAKTCYVSTVAGSPRSFWEKNFGIGRAEIRRRWHIHRSWQVQWVGIDAQDALRRIVLLLDFLQFEPVRIV